MAGSGVAALARLGRSCAAVALCAQLAHVALYGSVLPHVGAHGYLGWYLPVLAVTAAVILAALPASLTCGVVANGRRSFGALLPARRHERIVPVVLRLAVASGAYLLLQESFERTAESGSLQAASFSPLTWVGLAFALVLAAAVVVALERSIACLVVRLATRMRSRGTVESTLLGTMQRLPRLRPLAVHGALRAPPASV
jgi:hypothetical protein